MYALHAHQPGLFSAKPRDQTKISGSLLIAAEINEIVVLGNKITIFYFAETMR